MSTTQGKLSLALESLQVESFAASEAEPELRGTVEAHEMSGNNQCWTWYDRSCPPNTVCVG